MGLQDLNYFLAVEPQHLTQPYCVLVGLGQRGVRTKACSADLSQTLAPQGAV